MTRIRTLVEPTPPRRRPVGAAVALLALGLVSVAWAGGDEPVEPAPPTVPTPTVGAAPTTPAPAPNPVGRWQQHLDDAPNPFDRWQQHLDDADNPVGRWQQHLDDADAFWRQQRAEAAEVRREALDAARDARREALDAARDVREETLEASREARQEAAETRREVLRRSFGAYDELTSDEAWTQRWEEADAARREALADARRTFESNLEDQLNAAEGVRKEALAEADRARRTALADAGLAPPKRAKRRARLRSTKPTPIPFDHTFPVPPIPPMPPVDASFSVVTSTPDGEQVVVQQHLVGDRATVARKLRALVEELEAGP